MPFLPFDQFLTDDTYDTELLNLKICRGAIEHNGTGRLTCKIGGSQSLWAVTTGAPEPITLLSPQMGALIPVDFYYSMGATNRQGYSIAVDRICDQGGEIGTNPKVWNYQNAFNSSVRFSKGRSTPQASGGQLICDFPVLRERLRYYIRPENDLHLESQAKVGRLILGTIRRDLFLITFEPAEGTNVDVSSYLDAAVLGLGFVFGQLGKEVVRREFEANKTTDSIPATQRVSSSALYSPFGPKTEGIYFSCDQWMTLWTKATDFFSEPGNRFANNQLTALWNSVDRSFSVSALIACSVLEGFCNKLKKATVIEPGLSEKQLDMLQKIISSSEFRGGNADPQAEAEIMKRIVGSFNSKNTGNVLRHWVTTGKFGLSLAVLESYKALRNKPAHGHFDLFDVTSEKRAELVAHRNTIYQAVNSILLSCMGYNGPIFDWQRGEVRQFQSVD